MPLSPEKQKKFDSIFKGTSLPSFPVKPQPEQQIPETRENEKGVFGRAFDLVKERSGKVRDVFKQTARGEISPIETGVQTVGQVAGGVSDVLGEAVVSAGKAVLPKSAEQKIADRFADLVQRVGADKAFERYEKWKAAHPRAAANVESTVNIATLFPITKGAKIAGKGAQATTKSTARATGRAARSLRPIKNLDETLEEITQFSAKKDPERFVKNIAQSKRALSSLDTSGVTSYEDLKNLADDAIKQFATKQDELLGTVKFTKKIDDLTETVIVGDETVKKNFVKQALDDLTEVYGKINEPEKLAQTRQLRNKAVDQGLTVQEINQLARNYATDMPKAFSKAGEPLTSVNKVASENVRKGLKKTSRDLIKGKPGDASKLLDEKMSDLFTLRDAARTMEGAVRDLAKKVEKRGLLERIGRKTGQIVDMTTGRLLSGILNSFVKSNVGLKTLNALDLEKKLQANLKKVRALVSEGADDDIIKFVDDIIEENAQLFLPPPRPGLIDEQVFTPLNMPIRTQSAIDAADVQRAGAFGQAQRIRNIPETARQSRLALPPAGGTDDTIRLPSRSQSTIDAENIRRARIRR